MEKYISDNDKEIQNQYREKIKQYVSLLEKEIGKKPTAQVITYGCQQNEADSEIIAGELSSYGYSIVMGENDDILPDAIVMNTCAVREHAELKALSKAGNLKQKKKKNPHLVTGIGGCMVQQAHRQSFIKGSYPYVDFLFGTNSLPHFPEIFYKALTDEKRVFHIEENDGYFPEGMDSYRESKDKAYVSVMYGCNNFCSYCIVPYVKGRERSREPQNILNDIKKLVGDGCTEITLLGQNVNSYGKELNPPVSFAKLCEMICGIDGDFTVKFMTSHPKDVSDELIKCIADNPKMAHYIHFPIQSGSNEILKKMNRRYTFEDYYEKVEKIRKFIPDAVLSADVIVGFPGETEEDFECTLEAIRKIRYDALFTFIYSKRNGTPASEMENQVPEDVKKERMSRLLALQTEIMADINSKLLGQNVRVHIDGVSKKDENMLTGRTDGNKIVHIASDGSLKAGDIVNVKITKAMSYMMYGETLKKENTK